MGITEITETGWLSRLRESIGGVIAGLIMFIIAFPLTFWNEGRTVKRARTLEGGLKIFISVPVDTVDPANEKKLVHTTGLATTDEVLEDEDFGVSENAIKLIRDAEMYQWREETHTKTKKKVGGGTRTETTYTYEKAWSPSVINSENFYDPNGHHNPTTMPVEGMTRRAMNVTLGAFTLPDSIIDGISTSEPVPLSEETLKKVPRATRRDLKLSGNYYYMGADPASPAIGDTRISFEVVKPTQISVVARQVGDSFDAYPMKEGSIQLLGMGTVSGEEMFQSAKDENKLLGWILRGVGFLLMAFGIGLIFRPLRVVADVVPFFGDMLGFGIALFAIIVGGALTLTTIAIGWVYYRPLVGIPLLVISVGAIVGLKFLGRKKAAAA